MRLKTTMTVALAAALLAGCGGDDDKGGSSTAQPATKTAPESVALRVSLSPGKVSIDKDSLPAKQPVQISFEATSEEPTHVVISNNKMGLNSTDIKKGDEIRVFLAPLRKGTLTVKAGKATATVKVTG